MSGDKTLAQLASEYHVHPSQITKWKEQLKGSASMDGRGRAFDNIFTERFWRNIKYEWLYLHSFDSVRELRPGLTEYIAFYNFKPIHQALGYKTPNEMYIMAA